MKIKRTTGAITFPMGKIDPSVVELEFTDKEEYIAYCEKEGEKTERMIKFLKEDLSGILESCIANLDKVMQSEDPPFFGNLPSMKNDNPTTSEVKHPTANEAKPPIGIKLIPTDWQTVSLEECLEEVSPFVDEKPHQQDIYEFIGESKEETPEGFTHINTFTPFVDE